ncbi:unnamed protein product [Leptidea sinapis]|uniref:Uncharacterized protein n=1 Tax=Leptidea sinapis TaxID=189913 RepID=A0A5E4QBZ3_9NEOP|nr:unnamed protein product [Leptidea sinapis]
MGLKYDCFYFLHCHWLLTIVELSSLTYLLTHLHLRLV